MLFCGTTDGEISFEVDPAVVEAQGLLAEGHRVAGLEQHVVDPHPVHARPVRALEVDELRQMLGKGKGFDIIGKGKDSLARQVSDLKCEVSRLKARIFHLTSRRC